MFGELDTNLCEDLRRCTRVRVVCTRLAIGLDQHGVCSLYSDDIVSVQRRVGIRCDDVVDSQLKAGIEQSPSHRLLMGHPVVTMPIEDDCDRHTAMLIVLPQQPENAEDEQYSQVWEMRLNHPAGPLRPMSPRESVFRCFVPSHRATLSDVKLTHREPAE